MEKSKEACKDGVRFEKERETDRLGDTEMKKRKSNNFKVMLRKSPLIIKNIVKEKNYNGRQILINFIQVTDTKGDGKGERKFVL